MTVRDHLRNLMAFTPDDEEAVRRYCAGVLVDLDFAVWRDEIGNLYATRYALPPVCLNAHMDAVKAGIGADDRCGIAAILAAVAIGDRAAKVLLTVGEEAGGLGACEVPKGWFAGVALCASFDRHGNTDIITHYGGEELAEAETLLRVKQVAQKAGMTGVALTPSTSMADAYHLRQHCECVNIATGFYNEHSACEYFVLQDVETAACVAAALLKEWRR